MLQAKTKQEVALSDDFLTEVKTEAEKLSTYLTDEQKKLLYDKRDELDPMSYTHCIYGVIFGDCITPEALEAFKACAVAAPYNASGTYIRSMIPVFQYTKYNKYVETSLGSESARSYLEMFIIMIENIDVVKALADVISGHKAWDSFEKYAIAKTADITNIF